MITHSLDKTSPKHSSRRVPFASPVLPYCQLLLNRLRPSDPDGDHLQTVGLTSCARGEGVSTVAVQLGTAAAGRLNVVLVEANWRRPSLAGRLGVSPTPGLSDLLLNRCALEEAVHPTAQAKLFVIPWGLPKSDLAAACGTAGIAEALVRLRERFDLVLVDLPPARRSESTMSWTSLLDGVLLIIEAERDQEADARTATATLAASQANVLGAVLNKRRRYLPRWMDHRG